MKKITLSLMAFAFASGCSTEPNFPKSSQTNDQNLGQTEIQLKNLAEQLKIQGGSMEKVTNDAFVVCQQDGLESDTCKWHFTKMAVVNYETTSTLLSSFEIMFPMEKDVIAHNSGLMSHVCDPLYSVDIESITQDNVDRAVFCIKTADTINADLGLFLKSVQKQFMP